MTFRLALFLLSLAVY